MSILDRATPAYARGYRDCRDNRPKLYEDDGTFIGHDYHEGWRACWNEQYWDAVRENEFPNHDVNVAKNMVWYALKAKDTPSYSYWMIPGTFN